MYRFPQFLPVLLSAVLLTACTHDPAPQPDPIAPAPTHADTLSAGWTRVSTTYTGPMYDVFFTDSLRGWASSNNTIFRSTDGGRAWTPLTVPSNTSNQFINIGAWGNTALFPGMGAEVAYTGNGNTLHLTQLNSPYGDLSMRDAFFTGPNTAYLSSGRYIWRTTNGGATIDTVYNFGANGGYDDHSLYFVDNNTGWVNRSGQLYRTTDAGASWTLMYNGHGSSGGMQFFDAQNGYFTIDQRVYKTTDGGATASLLYTGPDMYNGGAYKLDIHFINPATGYVSALNRIYKTVDGGATWQQVVAAGDGILELHFTDAQHGWASGYDGLLLRYAAQ